MLDVRFSICHTTARVNGWREAYDQWTKLATMHFEYVLCVDMRWGFSAQWRDTVGVAWEDSRPGNVVVWNSYRKCSVDGWNQAARWSRGQVLILGSDDIFPPENWDLELDKVCPDGNKEDFVIEVCTGTSHDKRVPPLMALGILSHARYESLGYALYPEYESMASDDDFGEHARVDGAVIQARHLTFRHRHPVHDVGGRWDAVYSHQNRLEAIQLGDSVLARRRKRNFAF